MLDELFECPHFHLDEDCLCIFLQLPSSECKLETGRTHQIRVHMAAKGHPLLGDDVYGGANTPFGARHKSLICGQTLHACELHLTHPTTGERMHFTAPQPPEMTKLLEILSQDD